MPLRYRLSPVLSILLMQPATAQFGPGILVSNELQLVEGYHRLTTADVDNDGDNDIVIGLPEAVVWMENLDGQDGFAPLDTLFSAIPMHHFELSDMDGDTDLDLVVVIGSTPDVIWIGNQGGGLFGGPHFIASSPNWPEIGALLCHDLTNDGQPEVMFTTNGNYVHWFVNDGGVFSVNDSLQHLGGPASYVLLAGDMDLDGDKDQVTINWNGFFAVALNDDGMGTIWTVEMVTTGFMQYSDWGATPQLVDADGDGDLDLVDAQNNVRWARNRLVEDGAWGAFDAIDIEPDYFNYGVGWAGPLGCGDGASILWHPWPWFGDVRWNLYDDQLGAFTPATAAMDSIRSVHLSASDLNSDGSNDLIIADRDSSLIWWFPNLLPTTSPDEIQFTPFDTLCVLGDAYALEHAMPAGGIWTGAGVATNTFVPPGTGSFALTYTVVDQSTGCVQAAAQAMEVLFEPTVSILSGNPADECATDPVQYAVVPSGGSWTGLADASGSVDRSCDIRPITGPAEYWMNAVNGGDCYAEADFFTLPGCLLVDMGPDLQLCANGDTLEVGLQGPAMGGSTLDGPFDLIDFLPPSSTYGYFYPGHTAGEYTFYGNVVGAQECPGYDTLVVTVVEPPVVTLDPTSPVDIDGGVVFLSGGLPIGGTYLIDGEVTTTVDPSVYTLGEYFEVVYSYSDPLTGCTGTDTASVLVEQITGMRHTASEQVLRISPNPARDHCQVRFTGEGSARISLLDATGRTVRTWSGQRSPVTLHLNDVPAGCYTITVAAGAELQRTRLTIE